MMIRGRRVAAGDRDDAQAIKGHWPNEYSLCSCQLNSSWLQVEGLGAKCGREPLTSRCHYRCNILGDKGHLSILL